MKHYDVETLNGKRVNPSSRLVEYLVQWKGCAVTTWEPTANLLPQCLSLIDQADKEWVGTVNRLCTEGAEHKPGVALSLRLKGRDTFVYLGDPLGASDKHNKSKKARCHSVPPSTIWSTSITQILSSTCRMRKNVSVCRPPVEDLLELQIHSICPVSGLVQAELNILAVREEKFGEYDSEGCARLRDPTIPGAQQFVEVAECSDYEGESCEDVLVGEKRIRRVVTHSDDSLSHEWIGRSDYELKFSKPCHELYNNYVVRFSVIIASAQFDEDLELMRLSLFRSLYPQQLIDYLLAHSVVLQAPC